MSKKVVTEVKCSYGTLTGNVSSIRIETDCVPDASDYDKLKGEVNSLKDKIETLEGTISSLKDFISMFTHDVENSTNHSMSQILDELVKCENNISHLVKS